MIVNELINPKSIVVIGGSNDITKPGGRVMKNLMDGGFRDNVCVVNPKEDMVQGLKCYRTVGEIPSSDLAIIAIAAKYVPDTIRTLAQEKSTKGFIILSAGFSELGDEGKALEREVVGIIESANGSLIGPNCVGVMNSFYRGAFACAVPRLVPEGCDFVSGSGATASFILEYAIPLGLQFSSIFSVGNSAQIGVEEVLQYWDETFDEKTSSKVKLVYIEKMDKPDLFLKYASSLIGKGCKIAAIKAGTTSAGSRAVSSHTGALAGSDAAVDALFRKAGIVRCSSREEMVNVANVFMHKELKGDRIAVITHAGGPGVLLTDALAKNNMKVPHISGPRADELLSKLFHGSSVANPIDFLATGTAEQLGTILDYVDNEFDDIDAAAVIFGTSGLFDVKDVYAVLNEKMKTCSKPIYPILPSLVQAADAIEMFKAFGRGFFPEEVAFGNALAKVYHTARPATSGSEIKADAKQIRKIIDSCESGYLAPELVGQLLDAVGIPRAKEGTASAKGEAVQLANEIGFPVVMKVVGPVHKSDVGGVCLGIKTDAEAEAAFEKMMAIDGATGVLVQRMASGMEFFAGATKEDKFGHLVLCGLGGIFIEVLKDTAAALVPISSETAHSMIQSLRSYPLFKGVRGKEPIDEALFAEIITRLSALLEAAPEIAELDLNPLLCAGKSIIAVDARIRVEI